MFNLAVTITVIIARIQVYQAELNGGPWHYIEARYEILPVLNVSMFKRSMLSVKLSSSSIFRRMIILKKLYVKILLYFNLLFLNSKFGPFYLIHSYLS